MNQTIKDTFFFNPDEALKISKKLNTLTVTEKAMEWSVFYTDLATQKRQEFYKDLQICYYPGVKLYGDDIPKNCINVPLNQIFDFFKKNNLRYPEVINFDGLNFNNIEKERLIGLFQEALKNIASYKDAEALKYANKIHKKKLDFNEPLRIFLMGHRHTTVIQYVVKNIEQAFKKKKYSVIYSIEKNAMESCDIATHLKLMNKFNPHIVMSINHLNNGFLNNDIFNIIWFQDPSPILEDAKELRFRKRDIIYSVSHELMSKKFTKKMYKIQELCLNENIYFRNKKIKKENKIVFIGSSYIDTAFTHSNSATRTLYYIFREKLENSEVISKEIIHFLSTQYNISYNDILFNSLAVAVRECCVEWICRQSKIKVEVYGRHWDNNKIVKPFYKGELPYGEEVAKIYNSAKYSLSAHPAAMYQQRLLEMTACGSIPIAYDATNIIGEYKYKNHSLIFSNFKELKALLTKTPKKSVYKIAKDMPYSKFVQRILKTVKKRLKNETK